MLQGCYLHLLLQTDLNLVGAKLVVVELFVKLVHSLIDLSTPPVLQSEDCQAMPKILNIATSSKF
jgi:hypothetical protein